MSPRRLLLLLAPVSLVLAGVWMARISPTDPSFVGRIIKR